MSGDAGFDRAVALANESTEESLAALNEIAAEATDRGDRLAAGRCTYLAARVNVNLGRLDTALDLIDLARTWLADAGEPVEAARTDLGRMHVLDDLGRHREAIAVGEHLLGEVDLLVGAAADPGALLRLRAAAHENLGVSHGYLGRHHDALAAYHAAEVLYDGVGLDSDRVRCSANRGVELLELGRAGEALDSLGCAGTRFEEIGDNLAAARCAAYAARAHLVHGDFLAVLDALARSEHLLEGQEMSTDYARTELVRAEALTALNLVHEAEALYRTMEDRFAAAGLEHDRAVAAFGRANLLLRAGRRRSAESLFEAVEMSFAAIGDRAMEALAQVGRAFCSDSLVARDLARQARRTLSTLERAPDEVLAVLRLVDLSPTSAAEPLLREADAVLESLEVPELRWQVLRQRARLRAWRGDLRGALGELADASDVIERLRTTVTDERGRIPFLGTRRAVHEDTIDLLLRLDEPSRALDCTRQARSRTLVERALGAASGRRSEPVGSRSSTIHGPADELVLTYEVVGEEVLVLASRGDDVHAVRAVATVDQIDNLIRRLDAEWRRFENRDFSARHAHELHRSTLGVLQQLHEQLLGRLGPLGDADAVVVVPVGPIANIPFGALHDGRRHLIERLPVSFASSPGRGACGSGADRSRGRRLLLGVPDDRAPRIADEVTAIADGRCDATIALGCDATVERLVAEAGAHDVIHVACHGVNRPDNPALSALRLFDRWLTAFEITQLELDGQLVVLSACASGRQDSIGNHDEMVGLPRAFLAAGAGAVVVNLWRADDEISCSLMTDFHRRLDSRPLVTALRESQLALLSEGHHPYKWSSAISYRGFADTSDDLDRRSPR